MSNTITKKSKKTLTIVTNIVCAVLCLVFFGTMFLPFWTYEAEEKANALDVLLGNASSEPKIVTYEISLADYMWNTEDHEDLFGKWKTKKLKGEEVGNLKNQDGEYFYQNEIVGTPFICTMMIIAGVIACACCHKSTWTFIFPLVAGAYGVFGYLTSPMLQTGKSWMIQMIAAAVLAVAALVLFAQWAITVYKWFTVKNR